MNIVYCSNFAQILSFKGGGGGGGGGEGGGAGHPQYLNIL